MTSPRWKVVIASALLASCGSGGGAYLPGPSREAYRLAAGEEAPIEGATPYPAREVAIVDDGGLRLAFTVRPWRDVLVVQVHAYNNGPEPVAVQADDVLLLDSERMALRRIPAHELANSILEGIKEPPRYSPKYDVTIEATPTGAAARVEPDPWSEAGQRFAESWTRSSNAWVRETAHEAYQTGLADVVTIPPRTGVQGHLYFARGRGRPPALTLRLVGLDVDVPFVWGAR